MDNMNDYWDVNLKNERLKQLAGYSRHTFIKGDISDKETVRKVFEEYQAKDHREFGSSGWHSL